MDRLLDNRDDLREQRELQRRREEKERQERLERDRLERERELRREYARDGDGRDVRRVDDGRDVRKVVELQVQEKLDRLARDRKYDLTGLPNLNQDQADGLALKTKIESHILNKLTEYIIANYPRGNSTKESYMIAIVNVLRNIFKDPNSDIITYIEKKFKDEPVKSGFLGFFGGKTKRKRRKYRKSRRT